MKYPFQQSPAYLCRFDEFVPTVGGEGPTYFCRGTCVCHGLNEDMFPVDKDDKPLSELSTVPWTPEEEAEMEAMHQAYLRSLSCDGDDR